MKKRHLIGSVVIAGGILFTGCTKQPEYVGGAANQKSAALTMGIDRQDFASVANTMVNSMLGSGALDKKGGGRYVVMVSKVVNDTTQRVDTKMLTKKIRIAMLRSGKAVITSAVGTERDDLAQQVRVAKSTVQPQLSLSGFFLQRAAEVGRYDQVVDYYFQLTLTDIRTGLVLWEDEAPISKLGTNDTVTW